MHITSAKVTGTPDGLSWAQVHDFNPQEDEKLATRGRLLAVIATTSLDEEIAVVGIGREILSRLHEEYYGNLEGSAFAALKNALEKVEAEFGDDFKGLEVSAASIIVDNTFLASFGGGKVFILRESSIVKILDSQDEVVSASGKLKSGDTVLLSTSGLFKVVKERSLKEHLTGRSLQDSVEQVTSLVHSEGGSGNIGVVFIKVDGVSYQKPEEKSDKGADETFEQTKKRLPISFRPANLFDGIKKRFLKRDVFVHSGEQSIESLQKRKVTFSVGLILLVLLIVSIGFGIKQKKQADIRESYATRLLQAKHDYDEAVNLLSLSPERARELFAKSRALAGELSDEGVEDEELTELLGLIAENEGQVLGEYNIQTELFVDLNLLSEGFSADGFSESEGVIYILDRENSKVSSVSVGAKNAEIIAGPGQAADSLDIASYSDRAFLLKDDGIYELTEGQNKVIERQWEGKVFIEAYAGNIYLLEKFGTIARFAGTENGFANRRDWIVSGIEVNFSDAIDWAIDGAIWILYQNGDIGKYTFGNPQNFSVSGVAPDLESPVSIFTNDRLEYIYLLEPEQKRIVVITKEGDFKAQYLSGELGEVVDFAVSEEEKKVLILMRDKLLSFPLDHF